MTPNSVVAAIRARSDAMAERPLRANPALAIALGGVACLIGFVLVGPLVSRGAADDAGVMSFLLGEGRRAPAVRTAAQPTYRAPAAYVSGWFGRSAVPATRVARASVRHAQRHTKLAALPRKPRSIIAVTPPRRPVFVAKASPTILTDETLRRGDAVMTAKGLRIFSGARHYPYQVADFRPLAFAGRVAHRSTLLAIDRVVRPPAWSASFAPASPLAAIVQTSPGEGQAIRVLEIARRS